MSGVSVSHYLSGMAESIRTQTHHAKARQFPFITISRQTGAGGHTLAKEIVKQINTKGGKDSGGWAIFDAAMCRSLLADPRLTAMLDDLLEEHYRGTVQEFVHSFVGGAAQDLAYNKLAEIQTQVAALGKVVFVGSGASCATRDRPLGVHVRLVAPRETRQSRTAEALGIDISAAARQIDNGDRERERLIRKHFATDTNDPSNYDVVWNTARVPFEHIARSVLALVHARADAHEHRPSTHQKFG